jgi:hypothetical protein
LPPSTCTATSIAARSLASVSSSRAFSSCGGRTGTGPPGVGGSTLKCNRASSMIWSLSMFLFFVKPQFAGGKLIGFGRRDEAGLEGTLRESRLGGVSMVRSPRNSGGSTTSLSASRQSACADLFRRKSQHGMQAAAMPNGRCKVHGGKSTGPRTPEGLERSRRANWKHGYYSREAKAERSRVRAAMLVLRYLRGSI